MTTCKKNEDTLAHIHHASYLSTYSNMKSKLTTTAPQPTLLGRCITFASILARNEWYMSTHCKTRSVLVTLGTILVQLGSSLLTKKSQLFTPLHLHQYNMNMIISKIQYIIG